MKKWQCRHVRRGTLRAATTVRHVAIKGATSADELDELIELCPVCSAVIAAFLQFVEADDAKAAKLILFDLLRRLGN